MAIQPPTAKQAKKYKRFLSPGEQIITVTGVSPRYYFLLLPVYVLFAFLLIGMPKLVHHMVERRAKLYILTNKRILVKDGIFSINITSASYDQIAHIRVDEPFFKKLLFDTGSVVVITTSGKKEESDEIILKNVGSPMEIKNMLESLISHRDKELPYEVRQEFFSEEHIPRLRM
ncbi:MAG TPA: PH domain-containing protein [Patescibacteria group bacterium]|nr:PH domain-containing protein [Patescibacteria group bacterium]